MGRTGVQGVAAGVIAFGLIGLGLGWIGAAKPLDAFAQSPTTQFQTPSQPQAQSESQPADRSSPTDAQIQADLQQAKSLSRAFQHAAAQLEDAVVHINTKTTRVARDFFGRRVRREASGLGSGVVVSADGYVLTNNHVVEGATELVVRFGDGREYDAEFIGGDELRDIAVLRIDAPDLEPALLGSSTDLEVGQWVLALGSPFGFDRTVTAGIVSAKGRGLGIISDEFKDAEQFIQTDAAINPGNSGGPMINLEGEVVGINSAIFSRTGGSVGLGFSIPIELATAVYRNIRDGGRVDFGWLGVEIETVGTDVRVARVLDDSPASDAGLRVGDFVRAFQGRAVRNGDQLIRSIQFTPPGSDASLAVEREGEPVALTAEIASRIDSQISRYGGKEIATLGAIFRNALPDAAGDLTEGVYVLDVAPGGPFARVGLQSGDIITGIDRRRVTSVEEMERQLAAAGRQVRIDLRRGDITGYTTLRR